MKKIAMIYICTGNYDVFWKDFYNSSQKNFLTDSNKHYFVFTDSKKIKNSRNITVINQEKEEWPHPTLKRFINIISLGDKINKYDFIVFNNANIFFRKKIYFNELETKEKKYFGVIYLPFAHKENLFFPYDRNKKTSGYIEKGKGFHYYTAAFFGGKTVDFLSLCEKLNSRYESDKINGIYPIWHDESYLNKFYYENDLLVKKIGVEYGYPEFSYFNVKNPKVIFSSKEKHGGWKFLRKTGYILNNYEKIIFKLNYTIKKIFVSFLRFIRLRKIVSLFYKILKKEDF